MPKYEKTVPLLPGQVPEKFPESSKKSNEENDEVPNTSIPDIDKFVRENIRAIMTFIRDKCEDKKITGDELMNITKIAHTSFYRLWKFGKPEDELDAEDRDWMKSYKPNADHVCRICLAIGISLDEFQRSPTAESVINLPALSELNHEKIMNNMWEEIAEQRNTIKILETDNEQLTRKNEELTKMVFSREEDIRSNIVRINKLTDALIDRHDQMHELNRTHYEHLYTIFSRILDNDPQKLRELINEKKENHENL